MAISGSYSFTLNYQQLLTRALQLINVCDANQAPDTSDLNMAGVILNSMIKMWEVEGVRLWKRRQATLFLTQNQYSYQIGATSTDHVSNSYIATTLSVASTTSNSVLTLTSVSGLAINMNVGIELDDGSRLWTTISAVNTGLNQITINSPTTTTAAIGNTVVAYSNPIQRPLRILRATSLNLKNNNTESMMMSLSYDEYFNYPSKSVAGDRPNNFYYDKVMVSGPFSNGTLYLFPNPSQVWVLVNFTYHEAIQDVLNPTDNLDIPQEWTYPLLVNLACELCPVYGKFVELQQLQPKADKLKAILDNFDSDEEMLDLSFDIDRNRRNI